MASILRSSKQVLSSSGYRILSLNILHLTWSADPPLPLPSKIYYPAPVMSFPLDNHKLFDVAFCFLLKV